VCNVPEGEAPSCGVPGDVGFAIRTESDGEETGNETFHIHCLFMIGVHQKFAPDCFTPL
jgi:hypothetical protein